MPDSVPLKLIGISDYVYWDQDQGCWQTAYFFFSFPILFFCPDKYMGSSVFCYLILVPLTKSLLIFLIYFLLGEVLIFCFPPQNIGFVYEVQYLSPLEGYFMSSSLYKA